MATAQANPGNSKHELLIWTLIAVCILDLILLFWVLAPWTRAEPDFGARPGPAASTPVKEGLASNFIKPSPLGEKLVSRTRMAAALQPQITP